MINVSNFTDLNLVLREMRTELDNLRTRNIDLSRRRVVNAAPSVNEYDYVVRKELEQFGVTRVSESNPTSVSRLYAVVFSNSGTIRTAEYASAPYIVKRRSSVVGVYVTCIEPPTTSPASFQVWVDGSDYLLEESIQIPVSANPFQVYGTTNLAISSLEDEQTLTLQVLTGGCKSATLEILLREI